MPAISTKMVGQPDNLNSLYDPDVIKAMLDLPPEEVRVFLNSFITLLGSTSVDNWLYQQIVSAVLSGVADNSLTDPKLSDVAGQIKERVATHAADNVKHITGTERTTWDASASETVKGNIELATALEVTTATDNERAVTPLGLKSVTNLLIPTSQLSAISSKTMAKGSTTMTGSFPIMSGTTATVVTVSIPISPTSEEVELYFASCFLRLYRGVNSAIVDNAQNSIVNTNLGYGSTFDASAYPGFYASSWLGTPSGHLYLVDAYISGSNVVLKIYNATSTVHNGLSQSVGYITRG